MRQWRLIYDPPAAGAHNMAVDDAILASVLAGQAAPTLRLYAWSPPCLSLGYGQKSTDVDFHRVAESGWHVVWRPTGGRAILHADELTYSVALPAGHPLADGDIVESYRRISQGLVAGLSSLGLIPHADRRTQTHGVSGPVCFETPSHYEITVNGRKLVGSAQVRRKGGLLQHGSLPLCGDLGHICDGLAFPDEASRQQARLHVRARAITLAEALGEPIPWQPVAAAIAQGFAQALEVDFVEGGLSASERANADQLALDVYSSVEWRRRKESL